MHALADCIETYATDLGLHEIVDMVIEIRKHGNRYGDDFVDIADYMKWDIDNLNYNTRQMLPALCTVLYSEAKKVDADFLRENKEYTQLIIAKKINDYFKGEFISKAMIDSIKKVVIDIRINNFYV